jgi:hypothetical protein
MLQDTLILQARVLALEGGSSTLGIDDTFGEIRPSLGRLPLGPRPTIFQGRQPDPRPRLIDSSVGPADGQPS